MEQLQEVKSNYYSGAYTDDKELIGACYEAVKVDYNYSDKIIKSLLERSYLPVSTNKEMLDKLDDLLIGLELVKERLS